MLTDAELHAVENHGGLFGWDGWAFYYTIILNRHVTPDEARDAIQRIHARHPPAPGESIKDIQRSDTPIFRSQI